MVDDDPRHRNERFPMESIEAHVRGYADTMSAALVSVDFAQLWEAVRSIHNVRIARKRIWVCGNGGSAAIADHLLCDMVKGIYRANRPPIHVHSLVANTALLTAVANDFSYEDSFARQLEMQGESGDLLLTISSSGNSPNILAAMRKAREIGIYTIAFTGFTGGEAKKMADISIHVEANNYGVVEDCHQALMHNMAQFMFGRGFHSYV
jgi:D-sedoheptulose 7-phosphate isomerase